jgi:hypothetical protein
MAYATVDDVRAFSPGLDATDDAIADALSLAEELVNARARRSFEPTSATSERINDVRTDAVVIPKPFSDVAGTTALPGLLVDRRESPWTSSPRVPGIPPPGPPSGCSWSWWLFPTSRSSAAGCAGGDVACRHCRTVARAAYAGGGGAASDGPADVHQRGHAQRPRAQRRSRAGRRAHGSGATLITQSHDAGGSETALEQTF